MVVCLWRRRLSVHVYILVFSTIVLVTIIVKPWWSSMKSSPNKQNKMDIRSFPTVCVRFTFSANLVRDTENCNLYLASRQAVSFTFSVNGSTVRRLIILKMHAFTEILVGRPKNRIS